MPKKKKLDQQINIQDINWVGYSLLSGHIQDNSDYPPAAKRSDIRNAILKVCRQNHSVSIAWYHRVVTGNFRVNWESSRATKSHGSFQLYHDPSGQLTITIGCRVFRGQNAFVLLTWALGQPRTV